MGSLRGPFGFLLLICLLLVAAPAAAVDESTRSLIREISAEGVAAYQEGDYELARQKLDQAFSMLPTAPLGLWSARTLEKLGLLVEARERYLAAERARTDSGGDRDLQKRAKVEAAAEREQLEARIPKLVVRVKGSAGTVGDPSSEATLTVAGKTLPAAFLGTAIPVNPGTLEIVVERKGERAQTTVTISEGARREVTLALAPLAKEEPIPLEEPSEETAASSQPRHDEAPAEAKKSSWQPIAGWIGIGLGVGGLAVGAVGSALVYDKLGALGCDSNGCPVGTDPGQMAAGNSLRTMSTVGYIAGGMLVATGVTLLLTAPKKERQVAVRPAPGGAALIFSGTF